MYSLRLTFDVSTLRLNKIYVTTPYVRRLQCGTWTDRESIIACRSKQVIFILFMAIKTWWRSRIYWLPWKIMLMHDISCRSNQRLVHVWCMTRTCTKFFQSCMLNLPTLFSFSLEPKVVHFVLPLTNVNT